MARALVVLSAAALVLALLLWQASRAVVDADGFADRAAAPLEDAGVRALIADQLAGASGEGSAATRAAIEEATEDVVAGERFARRYRAAVRQTHRAMLEQDQDRVTLRIAGVGPLIAAELEPDRPRLARQVETEEREPVTVLRRDLGYGAELVRLADRFPQLPLVPLAAAAILAAIALVVGPDRRRTLMDLGILVAVAGVLVVVGFYVLRWLAEGRTGSVSEEAAVRAVWDAFLADIRVPALVLAGAGAALAAAAALLLRPPDPYGRSR